MSLISAGSISLDSTFNASPLHQSPFLACTNNKQVTTAFSFGNKKHTQFLKKHILFQKCSRKD
jgi:hypothetical protein